MCDSLELLGLQVKSIERKNKNKSLKSFACANIFTADLYFWTDFNGKVGLNVELMNFNFTFSRGALGVLGVEGLGGCTL